MADMEQFLSRSARRRSLAEYLRGRLDFGELAQALEGINQLRAEGSSFQQAWEEDFERALDAPHANDSFEVSTIVDDFFTQLVFALLEYELPLAISVVQEELSGKHVEPDDAVSVVSHMTFTYEEAEEDLLAVMKRAASGVFGVPVIED